MKLWLIWFLCLLGFTCCCAQFYPTAFDISYEEVLNREEDTITEPFTEEIASSDQYPTLDDEDTLEDWFSTTVSLEESVTAGENYTDLAENMGMFNEMPSYNVEEEDWYSGYGLEAKLRIEYTPYSALLYQEDEFGLEFLCPGYWLQKGVLLIRGDCWPKDGTLTVEDTVAKTFLTSNLNLAILRLHPNLSGSEETEELHLSNVRQNLPVSLRDCTLYVLQEDYALFEMYSWAIRPLPFKRSRALCPEHYICLRTRPSAAYGLDYALICDQSLVGMLTTDRTKYERVFGRLTLTDLSVAKRWIDEVLEEIENENEPEEEHVTKFLSLSATPMPPAEMNLDQEGDTI